LTRIPLYRDGGTGCIDMLLKEAVSGNKKATDELVAVYADEIYFAALTYVKDSETAREILDKSISDLRGSLCVYPGKGFDSWLAEIVYKNAIFAVKERILAS